MSLNNDEIIRIRLSQAAASYGLVSFDHWTESIKAHGFLTRKHTGDGIAGAHPLVVQTAQQLSYEAGFLAGAKAQEEQTDRERERLRGKREATVKFLRQLADTLEKGVREPQEEPS